MASGSRQRGRILIYIALILILALVAVWLIFLRGKGGTASLGGQNAPTAVPQEEMVSIVVTSQKIQRGVAFTEAGLTTIPYPKKSMDPGTFFTRIQDVVGKRPKVDLDAKVPVTSSLVVDSAEGSIAAFQIPKGMVAISIPINRLSSVSYAPQRGDHVNIIATLLLVDVDTNFQTVLPNNTASVVAPGATQTGNLLTTTITSGGPASAAGRGELDPTLQQPVYLVPSEAQRPRMVTQTLLQDAIVLQVGTFQTEGEAAIAAVPTATPDPNQPQAAQPAATTTIPKPDVITLIVSPQDAVTLNYLVFQRQLNLADSSKVPTSGTQLTLVLRGAADDSRVQTEAVTLQYLMDQYNIPIPAKLPYTLQPNVGALTSPWLEQDATVSGSAR